MERVLTVDVGNTTTRFGLFTASHRPGADANLNRLHAVYPHLPSCAPASAARRLMRGAPPAAPS